jgi:hypothetical protein
VLLCLKTEAELVSETSRFLKTLDDGKSPKKYMPVNVIHSLFSVLDLLTFKDGTDRLFRNVGKELPLYSL